MSQIWTTGHDPALADWPADMVEKCQRDQGEDDVGCGDENGDNGHADFKDMLFLTSLVVDHWVSGILYWGALCSLHRRLRGAGLGRDGQALRTCRIRG